MNRKQRRATASHGPGADGAAQAAALLDVGLGFHRGGKLAKAEAQYDRVLRIAPDHAQALNLKGIIAHQTGRSDLGLSLVRRATEIAPDIADFHNNLGTILRDRGEVAAAVAAHRHAAELGAAHPVLHFNHGLSLLAAGRPADAAAAFEAAIALRPDFADAHIRLADALHAGGRHAEALPHRERAVALAPGSARARFGLALALKAAGRLGEAAAGYEKAVALDPNFAEAHNNLGVALKELGRAEAAEAALRRALALRPDYVEAHTNLGNVLIARGRVAQAGEAFGHALELAPDGVAALYGQGLVLREQGRVTAAETALRRALALAPEQAEVHDGLGKVLKDRGLLAEAAAAYRQALALRSDYAEAHSNLLLCLNNDPAIDEAALLAEHEAWDNRHGRPRAEARLSHGNSPDPQRRLRIGYVSADFRRHPVGYFLAPVLEAHDHDRFETYCYSGVLGEDDITTRLRAGAGTWVSTVGMGDEALAQRVRGDGIDILVDLSGHTGGNRLTVFAAKPAPVQASWLGYFHTTGLSAMDYVLMDGATVPEGAERWFVETVLRLPETRFCYAPPDFAPPVTPPPAAQRGAITFGSFNNLAKVTPEVIELWCRVLARVPNSRLILKWKTLDDAALGERLYGLVAGAGIDPARVDLRGASPHAEMLAQYADLDIALDPFPYSGGMTSVEALWMGVPLVTLAGDRPVSRQTAGVLRLLGLDDLVAEGAGGADRYVSIAVDLAQDRQRLAGLRAGLRRRMAASPLCDGARFARALEDAYHGMWRQWCTTAVTGRRRGRPG